MVDKIVQSVLPDQRLESLYGHWLGKRRGRRMPARADIEPLEIPADTWPHTMLLDVLWDCNRPRFRYRRVGEIFQSSLVLTDLLADSPARQPSDEQRCPEGGSP